MVIAAIAVHPTTGTSQVSSTSWTEVSGPSSDVTRWVATQITRLPSSIAIERPDGPPLAVPVWYSYEPGGDVEVLTSASSIKGRLAATAGRASLCAQQEELPYKYVSVEGSLEIVELDAEASKAAVVPMAIRYLGEEMGRGCMYRVRWPRSTMRKKPCWAT